MSSGDSIEVDLQSTDYDTLKKAADDLVTELRKREDVMQVHSSVENAAPVIKVNVDPVKAEAEGLTPASIGSMVYSNLSGVKAATISVNGNDQDVKVEFAPDRYDSIAKLQGMMITTRRVIRFRWRIWQRSTTRIAHRRFHEKRNSTRYRSRCRHRQIIRRRLKKMSRASCRTGNSRTALRWRPIAG